MTTTASCMKWYPTSYLVTTTKIIQRAFLKGPDLRWVYAGNSMLDIDTDEKATVGHKELSYYLIDCMLTFIATYGSTIVARDSTTKKFLASFSLIPPYKHKWLYQAHFLKAVIPFGKPVPMRQGKDQAARFDAFTEGYDQLKREAMSSQPSWVVEVVAVADDVQGRGMGRKLLTLAKAIGESHGAPMFLACHDDNLPFYQNMGFEQKSRVILQPKGTTDSTTFAYNGMLRAQ